MSLEWHQVPFSNVLIYVLLSVFLVLGRHKKTEDERQKTTEFMIHERAIIFLDLGHSNRAYLLSGNKWFRTSIYGAESTAPRALQHRHHSRTALRHQHAS